VELFAVRISAQLLRALQVHAPSSVFRERSALLLETLRDRTT
jgi:hypothetical protein